MLLFASLLVTFNVMAQVESRDISIFNTPTAKASTPTADHQAPQVEKKTRPDLQFTVESVEPLKHMAMVRYNEEDLVQINTDIKIKSSEGTCLASVKKIVPGYFYINTEQCQSKDVQKGTIVYLSQPTLVVERAPAQETPIYSGNADGESQTETYYESEFAQTYIKDKLSVMLGYNVSGALSGTLPLDAQTSIRDLKGSNTMSFNAEYAFAELPQNFSLSGGLTYAFPRSFGDYDTNTIAPTPTAALGSNPVLNTTILSANLRYRLVKEFIFFLGTNYMIASMDNVPGSLNGDFGFHLGTRYYPQNNIFVEGTLSFYNFDYSLNGRVTDLSMNELALKGGYTF
ncbi:MAG: hypothetical protein K2Q26_07985 [Bdellovibrionales bacterium]|nr:hypothetical protein [Bdellovibrionales bacterium]